MKVNINSLRGSTVSRMSVVCAVILAERFLSVELYCIFIIFLGTLIIPFYKISHGYLRLIWPLLGVLIIGTMGLFNHQSRDILRDIAYSLLPISLILMGYWIAGKKRIWQLVLKVMVTLGFVFAIIHLNAFRVNTSLLTANEAYVRHMVGAGSGPLVVFAFVLGIFQNRFGIAQLFPRFLPRIIVMPVLAASIVLSYSRTDLLGGIVLSLALMGGVSRLNSRFVVAIAIMIVGYITLAVVTPAGEVGTYGYKLASSFKEIEFSDYRTMSDINQNWRGYEAFMAVKTFSSGNFLQQVFGQGFGALVDVGLYMPLGGDKDAPLLRYIPVTHNGYIYILVKTGLLGLVFYTLFYMHAIKIAVRFSESSNNEERILSRLLLGIVLSMIVRMYVIGGMAEVHDSAFVLLTGYLVRRIGLTIRPQPLQQITNG